MPYEIEGRWLQEGDVVLIREESNLNPSLWRKIGPPTYWLPGYEHIIFGVVVAAAVLGKEVLVEKLDVDTVGAFRGTMIGDRIPYNIPYFCIDRVISTRAYSSATIRCECGAAVVGKTYPHSDWCPLYEHSTRGGIYRNPGN